jgi:hypothetical protein
MVKTKFEHRTCSKSENNLKRINRKTFTFSMFFIIKISYKALKNLPSKKFESHFKSLERTYKIKSASNAN